MAAPAPSAAATAGAVLRHPYLEGNFAPVKRELPMTACTVVEGHVPDELGGGQYVRNGGNPLKDEDEQRDAHWFDGDGMLTGVLFQRDSNDASAPPRPHFINRYILTDVLLSTGPRLKTPIIPSIATFAAGFSLWGVLLLIGRIMRAFALLVLSWLPYQSSAAVRRISVANTSIWWHDGRAFAGCESGPPLRILLPGLETADWWSGQDEWDDISSVKEKGTSDKQGNRDNHGWKQSLGPLTMLSEFTTAHPRIDPVTNELLLYHMSFLAPFMRVSVIPPREGPAASLPALKGAPVPGFSRPKLAHDFCATSERTIMIDMPLVLDPRNLARGKPMLSYEPDMPMRFGVFPRRQPEQVQWYESETCCVYHAANAWDYEDSTHLVACRLNSATLVYAAGNMQAPAHGGPKDGKEKCQMYYWELPRGAVKGNSGQALRPTAEFALSDIPVEFPTMNVAHSQRKNRFVYATSMSAGSFDAGLGARSSKIDCIVKFDIAGLIAKGKQRLAKGTLARGQAADERTVADILEEQARGSKSTEAAIRVLALPPHCYAQEATFVPRKDPQSEDDGFLVFFVFDESKGLDAATGDCLSDAQSELWVVDARTMTDVVCRIALPQRVPYGLHGHFFAEDEILAQRPVDETLVRNWALARAGAAPRSGGIGLGGAKVDGSVGRAARQSIGALLVDVVRSATERLLA